MTTTCEAIVLVFELRLCSLGSRRATKVRLMEGVSRIYVDELGETNDDKRLKDNFSLFAVYLFTWFRNVDVCLLRQASANSAAAELPGQAPKI
jgi:hypothetical protein